jgi:hypothetical protein
MPKTAQETFKNGLDKAFTEVGFNQGTMADYASYRQGVKEDESEDSTPMIRRSIKKFLNKKKETQEQENEVNEKWSQKYKKSINCSNPKGFSQRAHCQGLKKKETNEEDENYLDIHDMIPMLKKQLNKGTMFDKDLKKDEKKPKKKETKEATGSGSSGAFVGPVFGGDDEFWERSKSENPKLEEQVEKVEAKEATTTGSSGAYESPSMWAKSTKKKDWGPSRKTQIPGGGFVKIKKKCTKFPYCNQGDINNVKISKNESVKEAIKNVSKKTGISENVIKTILEHEYEKMNKRHN